MILVPIRVGMIPMPSIDYRDVKTCPHTRGDDPELPMSVVHRKALVPIRVGMILLVVL